VQAVGAHREVRRFEHMMLAGIAITVLGFVLALFSLSITSSVNGRLIMVLVGIVISLTGILGVINKAFQKNAIWRK
jgi:ABC-type thiamin/hydroxymethylpyrimidine transport system permease subunit